MQKEHPVREGCSFCINHVDSFSGEVKNSSILLESSNGMAPFITEMSQSHHARLSSLSIVSCGKRYRTNFAGLPATIAYGGTSFVITLLAPIMAPLPIVTPDEMQD